VMTNRPWAKRWVTGVAVCLGAVGLAALLGAAMTPPAAVPAAAALAPTEQQNYVARRVSDIIAREHYREFRFSRTIDVAATRWEPTSRAGSCELLSHQNLDGG
jgi:hypothetical protein